MRKKILFGMLLTTSILSLNISCKKGQDDPAFSLRSRKARVIGDWKASTGYSYTSNEGVDYKNTREISYLENSYSGIETESTLSDTHHSSFSGTYTYEIIFEENGNYVINQSSDGREYQSKGTWNFTGKIGNHKNKQQLVLTPTLKNGRSISGNFVNQTFDIKELRNKKMVLTNEYNTVTNGYVQKQKEEFEFVLK